jgi:tripartite-type tricarboxylate transporter receptor subunit TctC
VFPKIPCDPLKGFEPIMLVANGGYLLVAHPSLPVKNAAELIGIAKRRPGELCSMPNRATAPAGIWRGNCPT